MVKKKEQKNWKHVTADMMSEEELDTGDSGFIRHRRCMEISTFESLS